MSARSALDAARPVVARLDASRAPETTKAELIQVWDAIENALRQLIGGSSAASGQPLIRDARARQLLTFDQANALIAFLTVREQLDRPGDQPSDSDVHAARTAYLKLDAALMDGTQAAPSAPVVATAAPAATGIVPPAAGLQPMMRTRRRWVIPAVVGLVLVMGAAAAVIFIPRGGSSVLDEGITAYQRGDRVTAASDFERATREQPNEAMPHVYLARMAREVGNLTVANQELQAALKAEPGNLTARREYGAFFLTQANYDQARIWYVHALEIDPNDQTSQGWLGCVMMKLNRPDEARTWFTHAGTGPWSICQTAAVAPGTIRP